MTSTPRSVSSYQGWVSSAAQNPTDLLRRLLASYESSSVRLESLGVTLKPAHLARARRRAVGLTDRAGLLVEAVDEEGPAATAGIQRGDLVTGIDGEPGVSTTGVALHLEQQPTRPVVSVEVLRGDDPLRFDVRPA